jgi:multidrug efflux pump subunit AcrA (membrane-fusion protein)
MKIFASPRIAAAVATPILAAGVMAMPAASAETSSSPGVQVTVVRAANACFSATIRVTGFLVPREEAIASFDAPGQKIVEVLAGEGDRVMGGQALVRLTRPSQGPDPGAGKTTTTTLRAPVSGTITRSTAEVGGTASPMMGEPLFRIAVDNEIELEAEVPSIHVPALNRDQTARVEIGSRELSGRVRLVPAAVDQRTQLGRARLSLERDPSLRVGMFAGATIDAKRSCGISVPRSAVRYRTEGTSVQIVRNETIETRRVQIGIHSDLNVEVRDGLGEGDLVVANAGSTLRDGDKAIPVVVDDDRMGRR